MAVRLCKATIAKLIGIQFETISTLVKVSLREEIPQGSAADPGVVKFERMAIRRRPRHSAGDTDMADVELEFLVQVTSESGVEDGDYALDTAIDLVEQAFDDHVGIVSGAHTLQFFRPVSDRVDSGEDNVETARVVARALAMRKSGDSIEDFLT